ncbi:MAG: hypothetical protein QGF68_19520, partial [Nitrospinota bacterium]|nr:hypothetical protein [Nitrospinota bacterium]
MPIVYLDASVYHHLREAGIDPAGTAIDKNSREHDDIEVTIDVAGAATYPVHADPTQIHQIITNLAINARDAMPDGGA